MARTHSITANGATFSARTGEVILDAALTQGVEFPHDCRAGRCGTCSARVVRGVTLGGEAGKPGHIYACQARALADLDLEFDVVPPPDVVAGRVFSFVERTADVVEVAINLRRPLQFLPGQYCSFKFRGFPARKFSPTLPADGSEPRADITLHVKRVRGGRVSPALGRTIGVGHHVRIEGPFGTACHRAGRGGRLVLVASGTGFAPILAIAATALNEDPERQILLAVGGRASAQLYMVEALIALVAFPRVSIVLAAGEVAPEHRDIVRCGDLVDCLPPLHFDDLVYACGSPKMVAHMAKLAIEAGADFHSDPFEASGGEPPRGWLSRAIGRLREADPAGLPSGALGRATRLRV